MDLPAYIAAMQMMDPGYQSGLGGGGPLLGGQVFPGRPNAQEFNYYEQGPPGTALVGGLTSALPLVMGSFNLDTMPVKFKGKKSLFIHWFDTREPYASRDETIGNETYKSVKNPGFGFLQGLKNIFEQALQQNAKSIVFQASDLPQKKMNRPGYDQSMRTIVDMIGLKGEPTPDSLFNQSPYRIMKGVNTYEIPTQTLGKWINTPEGKKEVMNMIRGMEK